MIKIVQGDILNATENIICQQVNCMGAMGSGLAKQIKNKYSQVYEEYMCYIKKHGSLKCLGSWQLITVESNKKIANLFGQYNYGRNRQQTDYDALYSGLQGVLKIAKEFKKSIAIPYGLGCGLAGGDWNIVFSIIEEIFEDYDVTIYKLA